MPEYIERMEQEFKETHDRYIKGSEYLAKRVAEDKTPDSNPSNVTCHGYHPNPELEMLQEQLYSMSSYLKTLGARIMFAKGKEGVL